LFELGEAPTAHMDDIAEVSNYIAAMNHGLDRMRGGFPLSLRLLREMHALLLRTGRGSEKTPGEFRTQQNWVGGSRPGNARFVPPPAQELNGCLDSFEKFLHGEAEKFPVVVQAALIHAQFETIHPFQDGNGRLGRMLVTLLMMERGVLTAPLLYMSLFLKNRKDQYYEQLQRTRTEGAWEEWVEFFVEGVSTTAEQAVSLSHRILSLFAKHKELVQTIGSKSGSVMKVLEAMQRAPFVTTADAARRSGVSLPTAIAALEALRSQGLAVEVTGRSRRRFYVYQSYVDLLNEGD
jgi:Fic family protein